MNNLVIIYQKTQSLAFSLAMSLRG